MISRNSSGCSDGGDSNSMMIPLLDEDTIWEVFCDMACALKHVHDSKFVHLDIKPSNFFVKDDMTIKLGDFG